MDDISTWADGGRLPMGVPTPHLLTTSPQLSTWCTKDLSSVCPRLSASVQDSLDRSYCSISPSGSPIPP